MQIIPVLDIKAGEVVRAWRGRRDQYRPLRCALCAGSEPETVLKTLLDLYPFGIVYIADIDAITGHGDNLQRVSQLAERHPGVSFWLDAGWRDPLHAAAATEGNITTVIGSETLAAVEMLNLGPEQRNRDFVLSMDYDLDGLRGPGELEVRSDLWPRRIIVMELDRVGAGAGPDHDHLSRMRRRHPDRDWYAAGGVRHVEDLHALAADGAAGVLVASILYDGGLSRDDLVRLQARSAAALDLDVHKKTAPDGPGQ